MNEGDAAKIGGWIGMFAGLWLIGLCFHIAPIGTEMMWWTLPFIFTTLTVFPISAFLGVAAGVGVYRYYNSQHPSNPR